MTVIIKPLRDLVLFELVERKTEASGIEVVRFHKQPSHFAKAIAVGPDVRTIEVGGMYVISRLQGMSVGSDGQVLLTESAVLAKETL